MESVFVALSGGADSGFAAFLLKQMGYHVTAVTFRLFDGEGACCSLEGIRRARRIADILSIRHLTLDIREEFRSYVIETFLREYEKGRTPNPCVLCNRYIKFSLFLKKAKALGADKIATGHYARVEKEKDEYLLKRGIDRKKDQSYFLYPIRREHLPFILFPLGTHLKEGVKSEFRKVFGEAPRESQDLCFVPKGDLRGFLARSLGDREGPIYLFDGRLLGYHRGIHYYTIGQRRGMGLSFPYPLYVIGISSEDNAIFLGPKEYLERTRVYAAEVNLLSAPQREVTGKIRYNQREEPCEYALERNLLSVRFERPVSGVAGGQSLVLYSGDVVIGGGTIL